MGDYGVAITWGEAKAGRERQSLDLWADAVAFNEKVVANGQAERWDVVFFEPSGAGPSGAVRYYGTAEQMDALTRSEEFTRLLMRGQLLLHAFGVRRFMTGQALVDGMGQYSSMLDAL
jgi:hypothetical protein